ncbi:MAG: hypothetical protein V4792_16570 [Pseudomonadota bacterium]
MAIATLSIDLIASLAKFEADMGRAARIAELSARRIDSSFTGVGAVFTGSLLAGAAQQIVRSLVTLVPSLVENVAGFQDLEEKTGASATALAAFQTAADVSGTSVDQLAGFMVKLTGTLSKTNDETKGAGAALKALGLDLESFKQLSPEKQFEQLAQSLAGFADGPKKTAIAIALLGKSGAEALPFLKELAQNGASQIKLTAEQIRQADDYTDRLAKLRSEFKQAAQVAALQLVPAFSALSDELLNAGKAAIGLEEGVNGLKGNDAIREFAQDSAIALATVIEAALGVARAVRALSGSFQAVGADLKLLTQTASIARNFNPFTDSFSGTQAKLDAALEERNKVVKESNDRYVQLLTTDGTRITTALKKNFTEQARLRLPEESRENQRFTERSASILLKPQLNFKGAPDAEGARAAAAALREAQQVRQAQLQQGLKLLQDNLANERDVLQFQARFLDGVYEAGNISLAQYYRERDDLAARALQTQLQTYSQEVAALEDFLKRTSDPSEQVRTQTQIADVEAKAAKARQDYAQQAKLDAQQQAAGYRQLSREVVEFAANLEELRGNSFGAAQLRAQQAIENARRLSAQSGGTIDSTGFERELQRSLELTESQRRLSLVSERGAIAEERFLLAAEQRGDTTIQTERGVFAIRSAALGQLGQLLRQTEELARGAGPDSPAVHFAEQLRLQYERAAAAVDPALARLRQVQNDVSSVLADGASEAIVNFRDLRGAIDQVGDSLFRIAQQELITKPLEDFFRQQIRGLTEGGGGLADIVGGVFGIGKTAPLGEVAGIPTSAATGILDAATAASATAGLASVAAGATSAGAGLLSLTPGLVALNTSTPLLSASLLSLVAASTAASTALALLAANANGQAGGDALGDFIKLAGFDSGGYTGGAAVTQPAGVVHGQEFVFSAPAVRRLGVGALEQLHRTARGGAPKLHLSGYADGGLVVQRGLQAPAPRRDANRTTRETFNYAPTFVLNAPTRRETQDQLAAKALEGAQRARRLG